MSPPDPVGWPDVLATVTAGADLDVEQARWVMDRIMSGDAAPAQVGGFLTALRTKGETVQEMRGLADQMLRHALPMDVPGPVLDVVGTGGDRRHTVNISTMAAIVCAAAGRTVVKHGNRAASSSSGSADVLEALGLDLALPPERVAAIARQVGITFCFAQTFHPSVRHAGPVRRELGIATAFNFLGPLTNPARPSYLAVGCADRRMAPLMAGVLAARGSDAAVFRGDDGLDEVTLETTTTVWWVGGGQVRQDTLDPERLGVESHPSDALRGGDAAHNARIVRETFAGAAGPVREAVVANAGVALAVAGGATRLPGADCEAAARRGIQAARDAIDSGAAQRLLEAWLAATRTSPS